ncbi:PREDICTED: GDSL esterase/lipase At5g37690-like [Ipomoea nil]|uniref:GDSL esterase/lipase At5g37690-like n=1 Tax=Ipomoea nil TaxID=35883 RepID=UPI000901B9B8|nr:PREDICTED: GDSL esterase/lipase At5g37690-like [Ipomoea nil]XP_019177164.1 PREDICTED: GDSL esterase/lipase At5g37690-like [Ipomoea nil]
MALLRPVVVAVLSVVSVLLILPSSAAAASSAVTYVFGDSLTEVGNNNFLQSLAKSNFPFYGIDYKGGVATGRFTNGRTIGDIISEKLGIPSPPPYLSLGPNDEAHLKGVNYASGGAGILNDTGLYFIQRLTFDDQIKYFEKTKEVIKARLGNESAEKHCNEALYFIGLGSNDYVNNFLQPFLADGQQYTHDEFVELLMTTLGQQLTRLHELGARKVIFHGLGPLGCIPSQRVKSRNRECLKQVNLWVQNFNSRVQHLLGDLNKRLPHAQMTFADTYKDVLDLIENPSTYGFKISNTSCCNVDTSVGGLCLPNSRLCKNRTEYVFWDAFHPSDAANAVLAAKIFASLHTSDANAPSPAAAPAPAPSAGRRRLLKVT